MKQKHYSVSASLLMTLFAIALLFSACTTQTMPFVEAEVPATENSTLADVESAATGELDETDTQLFERTAQLYELFREKSDQLWNENYRLDQMALLLVRTDGENDHYAYLLNHPTAEDIKGAERVDLPASLNLSPVYRFDNIPNAIQIADIPHYDFNFDLDGTQTYVMKYTTADVDSFAAPVSHDWTLYLAHEGLHDNQFDRWVEAPNNFQDVAGYPINADHLSLIMLEDAVLEGALRTNDPAAREEALKQFIAIRQTRISRWDEARLLDLPQEQIEGTARYLEHRLGELLGSTQSNLSTFADLLEPVSDNHIRDTVAFGRFYGTGAALSHLLDELGVDWKPQVEQGKSQYDVLAAYYNLSEVEIDSLLTSAKDEYNFDEIISVAEKAAVIAESEPTDIFAEDDSYAMGVDGDFEEGMVFPTKPFEDAPADLLLSSPPAGYELLGGYTLTADEIQEEMRPYYSPQDSDVQVVAWEGEGFLQVTQAQHRFASLDELVDHNPEFSHSERKTVAGQEILFDDFTDEYSPFTVASFIRDGEFIVVEGTVDETTILDMVADLLNK